MNENINLCKILKGHEYEIFYSPIYGKLTLTEVYNDTIVFNTIADEYITVHSDGKFYKEADELCAYPSKDQRDWNKWDEEQKPKVPKTWSELVKSGKAKEYSLNLYDSRGNINWVEDSPIKKSALALLKIHQLIEVGYGGNITSDYIRKMPTYEKVWSIYYNFNVKRFETKCSTESIDNTILFHTKEQVKEFLKYPENVQLLRDYFMI